MATKTIKKPIIILFRNIAAIFVTGPPKKCKKDYYGAKFPFVPTGPEYCNCRIICARDKK